jgi:hypothetical protein
MRDLEGDLSLLQRVVEFLPIEQLEKSHTVKAASRAWRTAARRALTRGRWKPLRTLDDGLKLICPGHASRVDAEARRALKGTAQEAWALYPGEVLQLLLDRKTSYFFSFVFYRDACAFLSLVVEPTKQGFDSIVAAFEKALQVKRRHINATLSLLGKWTCQAMPGSLSGDDIHDFSENCATPEWLGDELGRWADPALAVKVVDVLIEYYYYGPRYDDLARSMSVNWADSGKRARFVARFVERQAQEDAAHRGRRDVFYV